MGSKSKAGSPSPNIPMSPAPFPGMSGIGGSTAASSSSSQNPMMPTSSPGVKPGGPNVSLLKAIVGHKIEAWKTHFEDLLKKHRDNAQAVGDSITAAEQEALDRLEAAIGKVISVIEMLISAMDEFTKAEAARVAATAIVEKKIEDHKRLMGRIRNIVIVVVVVVVLGVVAFVLFGGGINLGGMLGSITDTKPQPTPVSSGSARSAAPAVNPTPVSIVCPKSGGIANDLMLYKVTYRSEGGKQIMMLVGAGKSNGATAKNADSVTRPDDGKVFCPVTQAGQTETLYVDSSLLKK